MLPVRLVGIVGGITEVFEGRRHQFIGGIQHGYLAFDLDQDLGIENRRPAIHRNAQFLHLLIVVTHQGHGVGIGYGVLVALVEIGVQVGRIDVFQIRQLAFIERQQSLLFDQCIQCIAGRHDDVVTFGAGGQFGQHFFVVAIISLHHLAFAKGLETLHGFRRNVIVPVIQA